MNMKDRGRKRQTTACREIPMTETSAVEKIMFGIFLWFQVRTNSA